jgi:hypothetical protein
MPINPSLEDCTNGFAISAAVPGMQSPGRFSDHHFPRADAGDNSKPRLERMVVAGEVGEERFALLFAAATMSQTVWNLNPGKAESVSGSS